jgi:hypothetical protein
MRILSRGPLVHPSSGLRRRISWAGQVRRLNLQYGKENLLLMKRLGNIPIEKFRCGCLDHATRPDTPSAMSMFESHLLCCRTRAIF